MFVGITRVRNEALILEDTLKHALQFVDRVILYDDCSTDETRDIARDFDKVAVIEGDEWRSDRPAEETRHRAWLLNEAKRMGADWCWCFDADERLAGDLPDFRADAYRLRLYDGYMSEGFEKPYSGGALTCLERLWGPEYRDIVMMFRAGSAKFCGRDAREPHVTGRIGLAPTRVMHFGKCLSTDHWEETCDYYATHWPEPYRSKWSGRRGKAIHTESDFGRPLYRWDELAA